MAEVMRMKYETSNLKKSQKANQLAYSTSTLQRYRNNMKLLSPYRVQSNVTNERTKITSNTHLDNNSHRECDLKKPQLTSNDLVIPETVERISNRRNKNIRKAGSVQGIVEVSDKHLDEFSIIITLKWN